MKIGKYENRKIEILGVEFDALRREDVLEKIEEILSPHILAHDAKQHFIVTPNPEIVLKAYADRTYRDVLNAADISIPDGVGILWAATVKGRSILYALFALKTLLFWPRFCRRVIPESVTGTDLMYDICMKNKSVPIFLLGAGPGIAEKAAHVLKKRNPELCIAGIASGTPRPEDEQRLCEKIRTSKAAVLFVAYGAPAQEFWIYRNLSKLPDVRLAIGVGGAFDFISGKRKRAPRWMRTLGLEWLYRVIHEPSRLGRIFDATVRFPWRVIKGRDS